MNLNLYGITLHPGVVLGPDHDFLFKSASTYCDKKAKVADFGLATRIYTFEEERSEMKVTKPGFFNFRWAAYEVLQKNGTAIKESSDIWSFGVLLWELFHLGCALPYGDMTYAEVKEFVQKGYRLSKPDYCPEYIYDLMLKCWQKSHLDRPTFSQLKSLMTNFNNNR